MIPDLVSLREMSFFQLPSKSPTSYRLINLLLISSCLCIIYLFVSISLVRPSTLSHVWVPSLYVSPPTTLDHLVFGIASTAQSWPNRKEYVRLWWKPQSMRGCVFVDSMPPTTVDKHNDSSTLPPICISEDTSHFRYTYRGGLRSAIRVARAVSETVSLNHTGVRWFVFGDDDTVFFPENLVKTLSKYDHNLWYYIGTNSESSKQNSLFSFEMAFGGGGFAISYPLARVLAKVFDSCLVRYPHLYGSDARIFSCLAELGVGLTHEPGFHQVDFRGDAFGLLAAHPLRPLVSLHHLNYIDPIFPNMNSKQALEHLLEAVKFDPARILQQTVCYDRWFSWTISVSWGYAVQLFERDILLPDVLPVQHTFTVWNKRETITPSPYMFDTRELPEDPCRRPTLFFLESLSSNGQVIRSNYRRSISDKCLESKGASKKLEKIRVFSKKLKLDIRQLQAPRRHCCDILPSSVGEVLEIGIRECGEEEMIFMHA
ncbi:PREDICTED: uncharacterized protein LOC104604918 [Nelumbo nucifera]|uniref:Uncharacterized protein n=2 Tax=Nelumbo nucifera TaxID=4432 RepID=A0A822XS64_NELNU|nr:PREDICTED: uncharacterized protein LOC104604918 [Nelumbo nucifera]DAD23250.1 TPA_asm: hypothetical protein HUJ06_024713 [Nelumbo nucifera]